MTLIKCEGCRTVFESTLSACPGCGRCPGCGQRRVSRSELADRAECPDCGAPYCAGCGRCHVCGAVRRFELEPHTCGFPNDPELLHRIERSFGLRRQERGGCGLVLAAVALVAAGLLATLF